jgi:predicted negative regulator of RcsB-dependent stress response
LIARTWGSEIKPPVTETGGQSLLDLRILAPLKAQRGDFEEALALVAEAAEEDFDP